MNKNSNKEMIINKIGKNANEEFTGYCQEENHNNELEFFCKMHNKLCCAACISKIKRNGKGHHKDCEVCEIEEIEEEKKNNLKTKYYLIRRIIKKLK